MPHRTHHHHHAKPTMAKRPSVFSKVFRSQAASPGPQPESVEVAGTFTQWQKTPLKFDPAQGIWQLMVHGIQGNTTHTYMLLVNGQPAQDKHSDGLAVPHTDEEKHHAIATPRGPRVFMLFSQTK